MSWRAFPIIRKFVSPNGKWETRNRAHLRRYQARPERGSFDEALPRTYAPEKKYKHAVLLLHGYGASPTAFRFLYPHLEEKGLVYSALTLPGFGRNNLRLLRAVNADDWIEAAVSEFDRLSTIAEKVSVVGHSNGGTLAMVLSTIRPVAHLVVTAPYLHPNEKHAKLLPILDRAWLFETLSKVRPATLKTVSPGRETLCDTLDPEEGDGGFFYGVISTRPLLAIRELQRRVDMKAMKYEDCNVFYGIHDTTIGIEEVVRRVKTLSNTTLHKLDRTAHNVLEDFQREDVARKIANVLEG